MGRDRDNLFNNHGVCNVMGYILELPRLCNGFCNGFIHLGFFSFRVLGSGEINLMIVEDKQ